MFDLHCICFLFPAGMYYCFKDLTDAKIFIIMYGVCSLYFAGVMVRLMLVLAPAACLMAAVALSEVLNTYMGQLTPSANAKSNKHALRDTLPIQREVAIMMTVGITIMLFLYVKHCTWVTAKAYSSPSIVLSDASSNKVIDDFREAYFWLRQNTPESAKVMSWWDYGYQITAMANRTVIVDNNTWNNTHIATVGMAMASKEEDAYYIMRDLDVSYVLVVFGGLTGYSSDDINKFLWMTRIGASAYPQVKEADYLSSRGDFRVDHEASPALLESV
jgi:dolichyl-diphosphooligosaccharide--protein glycosyltransferase